MSWCGLRRSKMNLSSSSPLSEPDSETLAWFGLFSARDKVIAICQKRKSLGVVTWPSHTPSAQEIIQVEVLPCWDITTR